MTLSELWILNRISTPTDADNYPKNHQPLFAIAIFNHRSTLIDADNYPKSLSCLNVSYAIAIFGHWARGIGHWALGIGQGALGMRHGVWGDEEDEGDGLRGRRE